MMTTNEIEPIYGEEELFSYLQWLRLSTAKKLNDQKMADNKVIEGESIKNFGKKLRNAFGRYNAKDSKIETSINAYIGSGKAFQNKQGAKQAMAKMFANDANGVAKLLFAVNIVIDSQYEYKYEKEGLREASEFLFGDRNKLQNIKDELEENYKAIAKKPLSGLQKTVLATVVITSIAAAVLIPTLGGKALAANAAGISLTLRSAGFATVANAVTAMRVASIVSAAALIGGTYIGMDLHNRKVVREQFKKTTPEENNMYLAIQCLIIKHLKAELSEHEFKNELDQILKSLNSLKGDLDYYLFVEKEDIKDNINKLHSFHGFDGRLSKILNI